MPDTLSRRQFMAGSLAAMTTAPVWVRAFRVTPARAAEGCATPARFPIRVYRQGWQNWAGDIRVEDVWTCAPHSAAEVVAVANWAQRSRWRVRARGRMHNWSPLTVSAADACQPVVLVDTTQHLNAMRMTDGGTRVTVGTGATMEALLGFLEQHGRGVAACPAPGDVTVGGVLAIGGHGNAVPATAEAHHPGHTYGTVSNLVMSLTAVVWDDRRDRFVLRTFDRSHRDIAALLVHLGRAFLTEVTLATGANQNLRCVSTVDVSVAELCGPPGAGGRSMERLLEETGRVESIWFAFTDRPWTKTWAVAPTAPVTARKVTAPYNYPFSDNLPDSVEHFAHQIVTGNTEVTPEFGQAEYDVSVAGLAATAGYDLWGPSKNVLLYIRPTTLRVTSQSSVIVTRRDLVQEISYEFARYHQRHVDAYRARGLFPINGPAEIRVTGLDTGADVGADTAPALSPPAADSDHPEWDTAVWIETLTFPNTPERDGAAVFYDELEGWFEQTFGGAHGVVRPEWSKSWAYTANGPFTNRERIRSSIPRAFGAGTRHDRWDFAVTTLDRYDPHRVFTNSTLDMLLRTSR